MARIRTTGFISEIKGKVQGSVFQSGTSGIILRNNSTNKNKQSKNQIARRINTATLQQNWKDLTTTQRTLWTQFAQYRPIQQKKQADRFINGQQAFIKFNSYRLLYGFSILSTPLFQPIQTSPVSFQVATDGIFLYLIPDRTLDNTKEFIIMQMTLPFPITINRFENRLRNIIFPTDGGLFLLIQSQYTAVFGNIPEINDWIGIKYSMGDIETGTIIPFVTQKIQVQSFF